MDPAIIAAAVLAICALALIGSGLRVIAEHERGVVLRLGRRGPLLDPGLRLVVPLGVDRVIRVDLRSTVLEVPAQGAITNDGVPVRVSASVHLQVLNPLLAVTRVKDYRLSVLQVVQAALRDVIAATSLRALLIEPDPVRDGLARFVDTRTEPWGVQCTAVDVREVELPAELRRAMEAQAQVLATQESQRLRAEGELAAAHRLTEVAAILSTQPNAVQLRFLQALTEIGDSNATVVVVPLPVDLVQPFLDLQGYATTPRVQREGGMPAAAAGPPQPEPATGESTPGPSAGTDPAPRSPGAKR